MTLDALNFMLVEIVVCLALAALLGLLVGWLMRRAIAKRQAIKAEQEANARYAKLEESSRQDSKNLEDQIQALGGELKSLKGSNKSLNNSLRETETSIHKARSETIELNQAQLETNERLQAIIKEKDQEIRRLTETPTSSNANLAAAAATVGASAALISRVSAPQDDGIDGNETLDATTVLSGPLHRGENADDNDDYDSAVDALNSSTDQLRSERKALLDAITDGEETIAIDHNDLPKELQDAVNSFDTDPTLAISDFDTTVNLGPDGDDTELSDTLETP